MKGKRPKKKGMQLTRNERALIRSMRETRQAMPQEFQDTNIGAQVVVTVFGKQQLADDGRFLGFITAASYVERGYVFDFPPMECAWHRATAIAAKHQMDKYHDIVIAKTEAKERELTGIVAETTVVEGAASAEEVEAMLERERTKEVH